MLACIVMIIVTSSRDHQTLTMIRLEMVMVQDTMLMWLGAM